MNLTTHELQLESLDGLAEVDTLLLFVPEDERPLDGLAGYADWRLCGALSRVLLAGFFTGAKGDSVLLPSDGRLGAPRVLMVGVGPSKQLTPDALGTVLRGCAEQLNKLKATGIATEPPGRGALDEAARAQSFASAFLPQFHGSRVALVADKGLGKHFAR